MGPYVGIVTNNVDVVRAGRLQVYIEEFGATNSDGSPNLNLVSEFARQKGQELAEAGSGFVNVAIPPDIILPSGRPSQLTLSGKKF
jgi:hypothetical protein